MQLYNLKTLAPLYNIIFNYINLETLNLKYGLYSIILDIFNIKEWIWNFTKFEKKIFNFSMTSTLKNYIWANIARIN